jgi:Mg-chelatase subunit ChlD
MGRKRSFKWGAFLLIVAVIGATRVPDLLKGRKSGTWSDKKYVLSFDKGFPRGANSVDELGISVVVAVDVSGSMEGAPAGGGAAKYVQAAKALSSIAGYLESLVAAQPELVVKAAVIAFSDEAEVLLPLVALDKEGIAALERVVSDPANFAPRENTAIGLAVEKGTEILAASGTILRSLLVITDGENTKGIDPASALAAVYADRNSASTKDIKVSTSGELVSFIGFDVDSGIFSPLAAEGARVSSAADGAALASELKGILEADITKLEAE